MYSFLLSTHSWLRWVVVFLAAFVLVQALLGFLSARPYSKMHNGISAGFVGTLHLQLLIGLLLYFVYSPWGYALLSKGMKAVMSDSTNRFWAVEHITTMIVAVIIAQVGRSLGKKAKTSKARFQKELVFYSVAVILIFISIPWASRAWW